MYALLFQQEVCRTTVATPTFEGLFVMLLLINYDCRNVLHEGCTDQHYDFVVSSHLQVRVSPFHFPQICAVLEHIPSAHVLTRPAIHWLPS